MKPCPSAFQGPEVPRNARVNDRALPHCSKVVPAADRFSERAAAISNTVKSKSVRFNSIPPIVNESCGGNSSNTVHIRISTAANLEKVGTWRRLPNRAKRPTGSILFWGING